MDMDGQLAIAAGMKNHGREIKDLGESMKSWEQGMKKDDLKRIEQNRLLDQQDNREVQSSEANKKARYVAFKNDGNTCFKTGKFSDAIGWYDKAMAESTDNTEISILYSNRAICQIKLRQFGDALLSCKKAIELDASNEKAWFRRMVSNDELNHQPEALAAGQQVLKLNPKNKEALKLVERLRDVKAPIKRVYKSTLDGLGKEVQFYDKPPHLQSRGPLKRIVIENKVEKTPAEITEPKTEVSESNIDMDFIEKSDQPEGPKKIVSSTSFQKNTKEMENNARKSDFVRPSTSTEFAKEWKCKTSEERFQYLKMIPAESLLKFVDTQLDSAMLSQLLQTLSTDFVNNDIPPMNYLLELTKCKELGILAMMIMPEDRKALETIIAYTNRRHDMTLKLISKAFTI